MSRDIYESHPVAWTSTPDYLRYGLMPASGATLMAAQVLLAEQMKGAGTPVTPVTPGDAMTQTFEGGQAVRPGGSELAGAQDQVPNILNGTQPETL